jgi:hypothetical protein
MIEGFDWRLNFRSLAGGVVNFTRGVSILLAVSNWLAEDRKLEAYATLAFRILRLDVALGYSFPRRPLNRTIRISSLVHPAGKQ